MEELLEASRSSVKEVSPSEPEGGEGVGGRRKSEIGSPPIKDEQQSSQEHLGLNHTR